MSVKCPACQGETVKKKDGFRTCNTCGAQEQHLNNTVIWRLQSGRIVAAPQMEDDKLQKSKDDWPSGIWE